MKTFSKLLLTLFFTSTILLPSVVLGAIVPSSGSNWNAFSFDTSYSDNINLRVQTSVDSYCDPDTNDGLGRGGRLSW